MRPAPGSGLAHQELLERQGRARERRARCPGMEQLELVAQAENARRLEAHDGHAAADERLERVEQAPGFGTRGFDHARREVRPAAAERAAVGRYRRADGVPAGRQHRHGGTEVLRLEVRIEGVGQEHDVPVSRARCRRARAARK